MSPRLLVPGSILLLALALGAGCGGDDDPVMPAPAGFAFELTVTDQAGAPLPDLRVARRCRLEPLVAPAGPATRDRRARVLDADPRFLFHDARPNPAWVSAQATLDFLEATDGCELAIDIVDWQGGIIYEGSSVPTEALASAGISWGLGVPDRGFVPNGVYAIVFTVTQRATGETEAEFTSWLTVFREEDAYRLEMGRTDADGVFATSDEGFFPPLQGHQPQTGYDVDGMPEEPFLFSGTVAVTVTSEPPAGAGGMRYWMTRDVVVGDTPTKLDWVFVPDDSILVKAGPAAPESPEPPPATRTVLRER